MPTYKFKDVAEGVVPEHRYIVRIDLVPEVITSATEKETLFTMAQKERVLASAKEGLLAARQGVLDAQRKVTEIEAEIAEIRSVLDFSVEGEVEPIPE